MKILVNDVAAEDGGGIYVLKQFYREIAERKDKEIEWVILTSQNLFENTGKIKVLVHPEVKKSRLHRICFDLFTIKKILREEKPDIVISLQNTPIARCDLPQYVYLHQSVQFCPKKYSFLKAEERPTAIRQRLICELYRRQLPKAKHIFVQTKWMKKATAEWLHCKEDKITVVPVKAADPPENLLKEAGNAIKQFFYPARAESYKNHELIIEACQKLKEAGFENYKVIFTFHRDENAYAVSLAEAAKDLPIEFIGNIPHDDIWSYFVNACMIYPSYIETVGLPLLEARKAKGAILAADLPYAHEDLDGYDRASFFPYNNVQKLYEGMREYLEGNFEIASRDDYNDGEIEGLAQAILKKF